MFNDYIRRDLNYENDLPYHVLIGVDWNWGNKEGGYTNVVDDLQDALLQHPRMRVMFVSGYYDLATPFFVADYTIDRLQLPPEIRADVTHEYFPAGHMIYHQHESKQKLADLVAKFVASN